MRTQRTDFITHSAHIFLFLESSLTDERLASLLQNAVKENFGCHGDAPIHWRWASWEWVSCLTASHVLLLPEQISHFFFFASSASSPCQGLNSACQHGASPWPWWPVSWCWLVSCSCPVWPTSAAIGRSSRLSSSARSCSCSPTSGKIKHTLSNPFLSLGPVCLLLVWVHLLSQRRNKLGGTKTGKFCTLCFALCYVSADAA